VPTFFEISLDIDAINREVSALGRKRTWKAGGRTDGGVLTDPKLGSNYIRNGYMRLER
jgi:hypothetical protein